MTSFVQLDLFTGPESSVSTFHVYPEEAHKNGYLRDFIEASGGMLLDPDEEDPCAITIVDIEWVRSTKHTVDLEMEKVRDYFHPKFIYDSYREQELQDLNKYLIGQSSFVEYDANDLLLRRKLWSEISTRALGTSDLGKGVLSRRVSGQGEGRLKNKSIIDSEGQNRPRNMARRTGKPSVAAARDASKKETGRPSPVQPLLYRPISSDVNETDETLNSVCVEIDESVEMSLQASKSKKKGNKVTSHESKTVEEIDIDANEQDGEESHTPARKSKKRKKEAVFQLIDDINGDDIADDCHSESKKRKKNKISPNDESAWNSGNLASMSGRIGYSKTQKRNDNDAQTEIPHPNREIAIEEAVAKKKKKRKVKKLEGTTHIEGTDNTEDGKRWDEKIDDLEMNNVFEEDTSQPAAGEMKNKNKKKKKKKHNESSENPQDIVNGSFINTLVSNQTNPLDEDVENDESGEAPKKKRKKKKQKKRSIKESSPEIIVLSDGEQVPNENQTDSDPDETKRKTRSKRNRSITSNQKSPASARKTIKNKLQLQENGVSRKRTRRPSTSLGNSDFHEDSELVIAPIAASSTNKRQNIINSDSDSEDYENLVNGGPKVLEAVSKYREPQKTPMKKTSKSKTFKSDDSDSDSDTQVTRATKTPTKKTIKGGRAKGGSLNVGLVESSTLPEVEISPKRRSKTSSTIKIKSNRFSFEDPSSSSDNGDSDYFPS